MRALRETLRQYLERTGLPVYEAEDAPPVAGRPLVTFRLEGTGPDRARCELGWHGFGEGLDSAEWLTRLREAFPPRGVLLTGPASCLIRPGTWRCGRDRANPALRSAWLTLEVTVIDEDPAFA